MKNSNKSNKTVAETSKGPMLIQVFFPCFGNNYNIEKEEQSYRKAKRSIQNDKPITKHAKHSQDEDFSKKQFEEKPKKNEQLERDNISTLRIEDKNQIKSNFESKNLIEKIDQLSKVQKVESVSQEIIEITEKNFDHKELIDLQMKKDQYEPDYNQSVSENFITGKVKNKDEIVEYENITISNDIVGKNSHISKEQKENILEVISEKTENVNLYYEEKIAKDANKSDEELISLQIRDQPKPDYDVVDKVPQKHESIVAPPPIKWQLQSGFKQIDEIEEKCQRIWNNIENVGIEMTDIEYAKFDDNLTRLLLNLDNIEVTSQEMRDHRRDGEVNSVATVV